MERAWPRIASLRPSRASRRVLGIAACLTLTLFLTLPVSANQKVLARKKPALTYSAISASQVAALTQRGITVAEDYGPFLLLDAPDNLDIATAGTASDLWITKDPYARRLRVAGFEVDTSTGAVTGTLDSDLQLSDYGGTVGLYLIQFHGPLNAAWLKPLTASGMRVLGFAESNGFVVAAPRGLDALKSKFLLPPVQYIGVFQPGFKLPPALRQVLTTDVSVKPMTALLDGGQDLTATYAQLKGIDAGFSVQGDIGIGTRVSFQATAAQVRTLSRLSTVLVADVIPPVVPSGEREGALAFGNVPPAGGYAQWLSDRGLGDLSACPMSYAGCPGWVHIVDSGVQLNTDTAQGGPGGCVYGSDPRPPGPYSGHIDLNNAWNRFRLIQACPGPGGSWLADGHATGPDTYSGFGHGTLVASIIAGNPAQAGGGSPSADSRGYLWSTGLAPTAQFFTRKYFADGGGLEQCIPSPCPASTYSDWAYNARSQGATKENDSWNFGQTTYNTFSAEFDTIVSSARGAGPMEVVFSAGNTQPGGPVTAPATAKNVITVGASGPTFYDVDVDIRIPKTCADPDGHGDTKLGQNDLASYSNRGFSGNNFFVKPDLVAPGLVTGARTATMGSGFGCAGNGNGIDAPAGYYYVADGTSFAAPQVTGASVLVDTLIRKGTILFPSNFNLPCCAWEPNCCDWWPAPSLIKAVLIGSAETMHGGMDKATNQLLPYEPGPQGWGRLSLVKLFDSAYKTVGNEDPSRTFYSTGQSFNFNLTVYDPSKPVILVLVWTDQPAATNPAPANPIVNSLGLYAWQGSNIYCDGPGYRSPSWPYVAPQTACYLPPDTSNNVKVIKIAPGMSGQFAMQVYGWSLSTPQSWSAYIYNANL